MDHAPGTPPAVSRSAWAAIAAAAAALAGICAAWAAGGGSVDVPWAPAWDLRLAFMLDGLGALYGLLAAAVGLVVFVYAAAYVPAHLAHDDRPRSEERRFFAAMVLFLGSMVGLATAQDLILLFVFWDLTAIASYILIGFDRRDREARMGALMAMLVTGISAVLLLVGALVLRAEHGTTNLPDVLAAAGPGGTTTLAAALIAVAALAKSAQVPLHFWLPRAMAAPTPVSAYLHSAAMVAAGVLLLSRVHPLLEQSRAVLDALLVAGFASMAIGGGLALAADGLKRVLAYSTIAQYGYVVALLGIGGPAGAAGACFFVVAHAIAKSGLFLAAGAVTMATGAAELSTLGGLARRMPLLAAASALCATGIAGLPLTIGFFKDELLLKAALERGTVAAALCVAGAALTFAYMARFWAGIFLGPPRPAGAGPADRRLTLPVAALALAVLAGGTATEPFAELARDAGAVTAAAPVEIDAAYRLDTRAENLLALGVYAAGLLLVAGRRLVSPAMRALHFAGQRFGPERAYRIGLRGVNRVSDRLHAIEVRDLRTRVVAVIVPGAVLVALGVAFTPRGGAYLAGDVAAADAPLLVTLTAAAVAAIAATRMRRHLALALSASAVGFSLAVAFMLLGAPDVALVAVLVETVFTLLFVGVFALVPARVLDREARHRAPRSHRARDVTIAVVSGIVVTLVAWGGFSRPIPDDPSAAAQIALTGDAHGKDVVTVILSDMRGLDTLVEITVIAAALTGVTMLLRGRLVR